MTRRREKTFLIEITLLGRCVLREAHSITKMDYGVGQENELISSGAFVRRRVTQRESRDTVQLMGSQGCFGEATDAGT